MLPTMVRCRVRSTHSSTTCPSSSTAMRDSCLVALMTISRDILFRVYPEAERSEVEGSFITPTRRAHGRYPAGEMKDRSACGLRMTPLTVYFAGGEARWGYEAGVYRPG